MKRYPITPMPSPRPRFMRKTGITYMPTNYTNHKKDLAKMGFIIPESAYVVFRIPMPKSWTKKKKDAHRGSEHRQKPDTDNYLKTVMDAAGEDCQIWRICGEKRWADEGEILVSGLDGVCLVDR